MPRPLLMNTPRWRGTSCGSDDPRNSNEVKHLCRELQLCVVEVEEEEEEEARI